MPTTTQAVDKPSMEQKPSTATDKADDRADDRAQEPSIGRQQQEPSVGRQALSIKHKPPIEHKPSIEPKIEHKPSIEPPIKLSIEHKPIDRAQSTSRSIEHKLSIEPTIEHKPSIEPSVDRTQADR